MDAGKTERWLPLTGLLASVLPIIATVSSSDTPDTNAGVAEVAARYAKHDGDAARTGVLATVAGASSCCSSQRRCAAPSRAGSARRPHGRTPRSVDWSSTARECSSRGLGRRRSPPDVVRVRDVSPGRFRQPAAPDAVLVASA